MNVRENVALAPLTYYKIGGPARYFTQPENIEELKSVSKFIQSRKLKYFVLGAGSNVLFDDKGFDGLVLQTAKLDRTLSQTGDQLEIGASIMVIQVLRHCMLEGLAGFEFLVGVPGNMGGVMYMNAGTARGDVAGNIVELTAFDLATGTERKIPKSELKYSYRKQHFLKKGEIILRGRFQGCPVEPKRVQDDVQRLLLARKKSQPIDKPSCGSVFKNPDPVKGMHAWQLIDQAGLRGHRIGNAQISELHTNFIVNLGGATAADVKALISEAKRRVKEKFGVELEEEVRIL